MARTSAIANPKRVETTNDACAIMNHTAGMPVRRQAAPPASDPMPIPTRITVSSRENTARNPPRRIVKCRNHRISIPMAATPVSASAMLVRITARPPSASSQRVVSGASVSSWRVRSAAPALRTSPFAAPVPRTALAVPALRTSAFAAPALRTPAFAVADPARRSALRPTPE